MSAHRQRELSSRLSSYYVLTAVDAWKRHRGDQPRSTRSPVEQFKPDCVFAFMKTFPMRRDISPVATRDDLVPCRKACRTNLYRIAVRDASRSIARLGASRDIAWLQENVREQHLGFSKSASNIP